MEVSKEQEAFKKDLATAMAKAWEDDSFKQELLASPKEAIESITGRKLNLKENIDFKVTDQSAENTFYFNLPSKPDLENMELTEDQLELVAGGDLGDAWNVFVSVAATVVTAPILIGAALVD